MNFLYVTALLYTVMTITVCTTHEVVPQQEEAEEAGNVIERWVIPEISESDSTTSMFVGWDNGWVSSSSRPAGDGHSMVGVSDAGSKFNHSYEKTKSIQEGMTTVALILFLTPVICICLCCCVGLCAWAVFMSRQKKKRLRPLLPGDPGYYYNPGAPSPISGTSSLHDVPQLKVAQVNAINPVE